MITLQKIKQFIVATYWTILKKFCNDKKIPLILPLLIDGTFVTDIQAKSEIFNKFFAGQWTPLKNNSMLQTNQLLVTQARLGSLNFNEGELLNIKRALIINTAHDRDDIFIE